MMHFHSQHAPEPQGLGRSWFRLPFLPDSTHNREQRAAMAKRIERYRALRKPVHLTTGQPTAPERSWRDRLSSWLRPLDAFVNIHDQRDLNPASIKQARLYPLLRFLRRTDPALDKLAKANAEAGVGGSAPSSTIRPRGEDTRWKAVAEEARAQNRARAALLKPRTGTPT